jgi:hypothetical protein
MRPGSGGGSQAGEPGTVFGPLSVGFSPRTKRPRWRSCFGRFRQNRDRRSRHWALARAADLATAENLRALNWARRFHWTRWSRGIGCPPLGRRFRSSAIVRAARSNSRKRRARSNSSAAWTGPRRITNILTLWNDADPDILILKHAQGGVRDAAMSGKIQGRSLGVCRLLL